MAIATWKDLCIDAVDAHALGQFWGAALGLTAEPLDDGDCRLSGPTPQHQVWMNTVPEPVTVKQRVHLDIHAASLDEVLALGATPDDVDSFRWKIVKDPEGGELCVFVREPDDPRLVGYRLYEIVVDSAAPRSIGRWWADVLGATYGETDENETWVENVPGAPFECLVFGTVPEPKTIKNRIHWDVVTSDLTLLLDAGATVVDRQPHWTVLADPEGNEFCAFVSQD